MFRDATNDIVLILDDDSYPIETDFLAHLARLFEQYPRAAIMTFPQRTDEFPESLNQRDFGPSYFSGTYVNCATAIRRSVFLDLGGYPDFFFNAYDEPDFTLRCVASGWQARYETSLTIRHHFTGTQRSTHHYHARNEFWSVLLRCPAPQLFAVALFRVARQFGYAGGAGSAGSSTNPKWWWTALGASRSAGKIAAPFRGRAIGPGCNWCASPSAPRPGNGQIRRRAAMKISISSTNPCHLYPMAVELAQRAAVGCYYSGYPAWKLGDVNGLAPHAQPAHDDGLRVAQVMHSGRLAVGIAKLFRWQDHGFDRSTGARLDGCDFIRHAWPVPAHLSRRTTPRHPDGPQPRHRPGARVGAHHGTGILPRRLAADRCVPYDDAYFAREEEEYALADWHCVASTVVRDQLISLGIDAKRIWQVPYGADSHIFHPAASPPSPAFRIVFAGQVGLRKGLRPARRAHHRAARGLDHVDFYGAVANPPRPRRLSRRHPLVHGPVAQETLAEAFRSGSVLVLPSLEEGFGLVVPQALNCGLPVIVSDQVGGQDLSGIAKTAPSFPLAIPPPWPQNCYGGQKTQNACRPALAGVSR